MRTEEHFLLDENSVIQFVKEKRIFFEEGAVLKSKEIGDGNINYVFRVWEEEGGTSIIVKQADRFLRSSGRRLDTDRSRIEAEALLFQSKVAEGFVPEVYHYEEALSAIVMEDVSSYRNMREELDKERIFPDFPDQISEFLVRTLFASTDLVMDRQEKKKKVARFINTELCDISEDLVFTEPYYDYKKRNIITPGMEDFVRVNLYGDEALKTQVGILRNRFMNKAQALLHGDLHTGSIFIREEGIKVIDPEFAFYGPMGYDVGNVIGNLIFSWGKKVCIGEKPALFLSRIEECVRKVFDLFQRKFTLAIKEKVTLPLYNGAFKETYIREVMADTVGYAGTEIIRRVVGDAKVSEITAVTNLSERIRLETLLLRVGIRFIKERERILSGELLAGVFVEEVR